MARYTRTVRMVWTEGGTLEEEGGGIRDDGTPRAAPRRGQTLFVMDGEELIPLTYINNQIVEGDRGIKELNVDHVDAVETGYDIQIFVGSQPLGLNAVEGKLTTTNPDVTTFLYADNTDMTISCEYKGERWYWFYSGGTVTVRRESGGWLPTKFQILPTEERN